MRSEDTYVELELLERDLRAHGRFVARLLTAATDAFVDQDASTAELVLGLAGDVRGGQARIDAGASRLLSSPVGYLEQSRRAIAVRRANDELDRIAELTISIARLARPPVAGAHVARGVVELDALRAVVGDALAAAVAGIGRPPGDAPEALIDVDRRLAEATRHAIAAVAARSHAPSMREWGLRAMMTVRCLRRACHHTLRMTAQTGYAASAAEAEAAWPAS